MQVPTCTVKQVRHLSSVVCRAADSNGDGNPILTGPVSVNPALVTDAAAGDKAATPNDRSKGLWTRCDKCGVILYIKHLKEHHHICFGCNYHLKMSSQVCKSST